MSELEEIRDKLDDFTAKETAADDALFKTQQAIEALQPDIKAARSDKALKPGKASEAEYKKIKAKLDKLNLLQDEQEEDLEILEAAVTDLEKQVNAAIAAKKAARVKAIKDFALSKEEDAQAAYIKAAGDLMVVQSFLRHDGHLDGTSYRTILNVFGDGVETRAKHAAHDRFFEEFDG